MSVILSSLCRKVVCTDKEQSIVDLSQTNFDMNSHLRTNCEIHPIVLNWEDDLLTCEYLTETEIVVACDVAYDCDISDAFLNCLHNIANVVMKNQKHLRVFIAIEKRIVFCVDDSEPSAPQFVYFAERLENLNKVCETLQSIDFLPIGEIPLYFNNSRPNTMQLISLHFAK